MYSGQKLFLWTCPLDIAMNEFKMIEELQKHFKYYGSKLKHISSASIEILSHKNTYLKWKKFFKNSYFYIKNGKFYF